MSSMKKVVVTGACGALLAMQGCGTEEEKKDLDIQATAQNLQDVVVDAANKVSDQVQGAVATIDINDAVNQVFATDVMQEQIAYFKDLYTDHMAEVFEVQALGKGEALAVLKEYASLSFSYKWQKATEGVEARYVCTVGEKENQKCHTTFKKMLQALTALNKAKIEGDLSPEDLEAIKAFAGSIKGTFLSTNLFSYSRDQAEKMQEYATVSLTSKEGKVTYPNVNKVYGYLTTNVPTVKCDGVHSVSLDVCRSNKQYLETILGLVLGPKAFAEQTRMTQFIKKQAEFLSYPLADCERYDSAGRLLKSPNLRKTTSQQKL